MNGHHAQAIEMTGLLATRTAHPDPRVGLKAGIDNAGQAIRNMTLVASMPKPTGFFDPARLWAARRRLPSTRQRRIVWTSATPTSL